MKGTVNVRAASRAVRSVKKCPRCLSTEIFLDGRLIEMGAFYVCGKCGYTGQLVIEEDADAPETAKAGG